MKPGDHEILESLLDDWEALKSRGQSVDPEQLCQPHPQCREAFLKAIAALSSIDTRLLPEHENRQDDTLPSDTHLAGRIGLTHLREHAQGAIGRVCIALDPELNREVAIKFLQPRYLKDEYHRKRFMIEAEITSRLNHPGVIPIHGIGTTEDGCPFYIMPFVGGVTLQEAINRYHQDQTTYTPLKRNLEFRQLLNHLIAICHTMGYAHTRGIVHRDLKPDNILLGPYGEALVVDWGLATPVVRDSQARASGEKTLLPLHEPPSGIGQNDSGAGTPAYMSPELTSGSSEFRVSSDIYSLGAILYCILCGQSPAESGPSDLKGLREHLIQQRWPTPSALKPYCPQAVEAICLKAMSSEPSDRYPSAMEMAQEIKRYLADERVVAHRESWGASTLRFFRQHRRMAQLSLTSMMLAIVVLVGAFIQLGQSGRESQAVNKALLISTAKLTALTVRMEMERRWFILEQAAANPRLIDRLSGVTGTLEDKDRVFMADLLREIRNQALNDSVQAESWFICNATGYQMARLPYGSSIGQNFAHRDYFHGNGRDLSEGERGQPPHILQPYLSTPYASSNDGDLKVAMTQPVFSHLEGHQDRQFLGVLGMSIKLGDFAILDGNLSPGQGAVMALLGQDYLEDAPRRGLILHHPRFQSAPNNDSLRTIPRIQGDLVRQLRTPGNSLYMTDYMDPLQGGASSGWTAALEPVRLNAPSDLGDNGSWVVIVQRPNP